MATPRKRDELPEVFELIRLRDLCREFINGNKIDGQEQARAISWGRNGTYEFIKSICELIGYYGEER